MTPNEANDYGVTNAARGRGEVEVTADPNRTEDAAVEPTSVDARDQQLGRYRLCFEVAQGGMATVFLARTEGPAGFGRFVALKRIHPHLAREKQFVEMFLDEARIASMLSHPNACGVTDFGEAGGTFYLTMDYLVGESYAKLDQALRKRARDGNTDDVIPVVCRMIADACEGLHSAHELRDPTGRALEVVHRDISPHNLFVTFDGSVKVVDFGIASASGRLHHTATGTMKGKFAYMAPEQLDGKSADRRVDVWALGVVLWETIARRRLFRKPSDSETLLAVMSMPVPRLSDVSALVPPELDRIVERALARRPDDRYATAREFGRDLTRYISSRRENVGMVEIAELMQHAFPGGLAQKQQLLQLAVQIGDGAVPAVPQLRSDATHSSMLSDSNGQALRAVLGRGERRATRVAFGLVCVGLVAAALFATRATQWARSGRSIASTAMVSTALRAGTDAPRSATPAVAARPVVTATPTEPPQPSPVGPDAPGIAPPAASGTPRAMNTRTLSSETPHAPAAVEPARRGLVNVTTPGAWAEVYANGRRLGQTPGQFALPSGRQVLVVRPFGGPASRRVSVRVVPDTVTRIRVDVSAE